MATGNELGILGVAIMLYDLDEAVFVNLIGRIEPEKIALVMASL